MQFEVPQFIEIEDKIFGPFTWRQFLYLGGGVGMGVVLFFTAPFWLFLLVGFPLAVLAGALSFYPVNNRPFSFFLEAIIGYFRRQKLYLWKKKSVSVHKQSFTPSQMPQQTISSTPNPANQRNITSLARSLELADLQNKDI